MKDFLLLDKTQKILQGWNPGTIDVHERICKALLAQIKITPRDAGYWGPISQLSKVFSYHCDLIESGGQISSSSYIRERFSDTRLALGYVTSQRRKSADDDHAISNGITEKTPADEGLPSDHNSNNAKKSSRLGILFRGLRSNRSKGRAKKLRSVSSHSGHI